VKGMFDHIEQDIRRKAGLPPLRRSANEQH
jgi:hypothetical protein